MTAKNLLYLESKNNVIPAAKGTEEYNDIMNRLQETNYAHQKDEEKPQSKLKKERSSVVKFNQDAVNSEDEEEEEEE